MMRYFLLFSLMFSLEFIIVGLLNHVELTIILRLISETGLLTIAATPLIKLLGYQRSFNSLNSWSIGKQTLFQKLLANIRLGGLIFVINFTILLLLPFFNLTGISQNLLKSLFLATLSMPFVSSIGVIDCLRTKKQTTILENWPLIFLNVHLLIVILIIILHFYLTSSQKSSSAIINLAGRERMLSQYITKEVMLFNKAMKLQRDTLPHLQKINNNADIFEQSLKGLIDGDPQIGLTACKDPLSYQKLNNALTAWSQFKKLLPPWTSLPDENHINQMIQYGEEVLVSMDQAVKQLVFYYEDNARFISFTQGLSIVVIFMIGVLLTNSYTRMLNEKILRTQALEQANLKLTKQDELKTRFINNISHEIRTPLTVIFSVLKLLKSGDNANEQNLNMAIEECNRLSRISEEILDYERIRENALLIKLSNLSLNSVVEDVMQQNYKEAFICKISINKQFPEEEIIVNTNKIALGKILNCLLSNAIKFSQADSTILMSIEKNQQQTKLFIIDHGCGISSDDIPNIFDPFYQGGNQMTNKPSGTGIGLNIAKKLADKMNIDLHIESRENEGTKAILVFRKERLGNSD